MSRQHTDERAVLQKMFQRVEFREHVAMILLPPLFSHLRSPSLPPSQTEVGPSTPKSPSTRFTRTIPHISNTPLAIGLSWTDKIPIRLGLPRAPEVHIPLISLRVTTRRLSGFDMT